MFALTMMLSPVSSQAANRSGDFTVGKGTFLLNGKPFVVKAAEVHYPRIPRPYWEQRIKMCKALGMNTLCLYVFWNIHEPQQDHFNFTGSNDVAAFCRLAQKNGMYVIAGTIRLRRVGNGWTALVAVEEEGHPSARAGSVFHAACEGLRGESR